MCEQSHFNKNIADFFVPLVKSALVGPPALNWSGVLTKAIRSPFAAPNLS